MRATPLDKLYFNNNLQLLKECLNTFYTAVDYSLAKKDLEQTLLEDIAKADYPINATLCEQYTSNLRKAIDRVFAEDDGSGLSDCLRANVARFAAYKAYHATNQVRNQIRKDGDLDTGRKVLHAFNRYQAAEYNTTVSRCRTAKQFTEFSDPDHMRLFPNLRWLPSRSATPRELHIGFYDRVWAKDDPFWTQNQPGNLWNCKCDWEETDDPVTDGNPTTPVRHDGLEGNPALTGEVFTDNCAYIKNAGANRKERDKVEMMCEITAQKNIRKTAKQSPLLQQHYPCEIDGNKVDVHFSDWGILETAHSMTGNKDLYWLKNEVLNSPEKYFKNAKYISDASVDLSHNTNKNRIRLKKHFIRYYYSEIILANGEKAYLNVVKHDDGKFYLYTISKRITSY